MADPPGIRARQGLRTRIVGVMKVLLPLIAVALLAAVLLWEKTEEAGIGLTFSPGDIEAMRTGLKLTGPQLSGSSLNGDIYDFQAAVVTPRDLDLSRADIEALSGRIRFRDGRTVELRADEAQIEIPAQRVVLDTGILITTSDGYAAGARRVEVDLRDAVLTAFGPVTATGPPGRIAAGGMTIRPDPAAQAAEGSGNNDALIRFTGGVTLRYTPGAEDATR